MRDFLTVFWFELVTMLKKKAVIVSTLIIAGLVLAVTLFPMLLSSDGNGEEPEFKPLTNVGFVLTDLDQIAHDSIVNTFKIDEDYLFDTESDLTKSIQSQEVEMGFVVRDLTNVKTIYLNRTEFDNESIFMTFLTELNRSLQYGELGVDVIQINKIESAQINNEIEVLGRDSMNNFFITYVLSFAIYMIVIFYGTSVATAVAREKDDRTMELLVTSTKPTNLIVGKVMAVGIGTILQMAIIFIVGFIGFNIAKGSYPEIVMMIFNSSLTWDMVLVYAFYYITGYFLYLFLFSAVGSIVSRVEDVNSAVMPIMFLIMIAVFVSMFSISYINGTIMKAAALIPFTSFIAMPTRYLLAAVSLPELLMSMGAMILGVIVLAYISIRIYRWGTLYYGNKISLFKIFKQAFSSRD